jgi:hypothetical protein
MELITEIKPILFIMGTLIYLMVLRYFDKKQARVRPLTEGEYLYKMARIRESSEYDIFLLSAKEWNITSKNKIDEDFKDYLLKEQMPYYVKDYIRKTSRIEGNSYRPPHNLGGGSLPWLK